MSDYIQGVFWLLVIAVPWLLGMSTIFMFLLEHVKWV